MKKLLNLALVLVLSFSIVLVANIGSVSAQTVPPAIQEDENPTWMWVNASVPATTLSMGEITTPPPDWQQLLSTGLDITGPARICYPFRGAQFGWVGQIRLLFEGKWIPISTVVDWVPSTEGRIYACATARYAGTYALFGYWQPVK